MILTTLVAVLAIAWAPATAHGCDPSQATEVDELADGRGGRTIVGVYERTHIAATPALGFRGERSVSVVTRYWGVEPPTNGMLMHGKSSPLIPGGTDCGENVAPLGGHHFTVLAQSERGISWGGWMSNSVDTGALDAHFGPPQELEIGLVTYAVAWLRILWLPTVLFGTLGLLAGWFIRRRRRG